MRLRAARRGDAEAVLAVIAASEIARIGRTEYTLRDVHDDWALPGVELEHDVFVVEDDDATIVGWADTDERCARVAVAPGHEGRGVGTLLRDAVERRMRERGFRMRQDLSPVGTTAVEHLRAAGYERIQVYQRMRASMQDVPAPLDAPVRLFDLTAEGAVVHELVEEAFGEIAANSAQSFESWRAETAAGSEPAFRLALDDDRGLVGVAIGQRRQESIGYVAQLAVARRARGRGHGRALLLALLDAFRRAGLPAAALSVAATNAPATGLYESAGMRPDFRAERWELGST